MAVDDTDDVCEDDTEEEAVEVAVVVAVDVTVELKDVEAVEDTELVTLAD